LRLLTISDQSLDAFVRGKCSKLHTMPQVSQYNEHMGTCHLWCEQFKAIKNLSSLISHSVIEKCTFSKFSHLAITCWSVVFPKWSKVKYLALLLDCSLSLDFITFADTIFVSDQAIFGSTCLSMLINSFIPRLECRSLAYTFVLQRFWSPLSPSGFCVCICLSKVSCLMFNIPTVNHHNKLCNITVVL